MKVKPTQAVARPVFRVLAAIVVPVCLVMAIVCMFGVLEDTGKPDVFATIVFMWFAGIFGSIAATGRYEFAAAKPLHLFAAATKYLNGEITLAEYGALTKDIMGKR